MIDIYDGLYHRLGGQDFWRLFPVILTDNGSEFSNPKYIENRPDDGEYQGEDANKSFFHIVLIMEMCYILGGEVSNRVNTTISQRKAIKLYSYTKEKISQNYI